MKTAFLYAGQGSQHKGMGEDLYRDFEEFRGVYDNAKTSFDLKKMCFEDPDGNLSKTGYTQPCMVAFASGVTAILNKHGKKPDYLAGLSLGEYSALQAAGVWDSGKAISLAAFRGEAMTKAAEGVESAMTAVMGLSEEELQACVDKASEESSNGNDGLVSICNDNCPGQIVIGGEKKAVERATELAKECGAKRCIPLNVSGPFHTKYMSSAGDALRKYFSDIEFGKEQIPVVFNVTGREKSEAETVEDLLVKQVQSGVKMTQTIKYLLDKGVRRFVEIGPGKALTGFVKRTAKEMQVDDIECITLETSEDIKNFLEIA
ncbi:ACP S-malonyltransferase [Butyrivibrio sp. INlla16]|uniref:ACP S-malonyltransferase n=1 Tax=Butyrivibrio sp. INlla16 TaxID=1520807 RepID=UPI00088A9BDA|nr:ACP S-malonyltransferase [Butyrivibrio sp. INlla16]SDB07886.1 [acyl-carrier-protein] S-malonyltransferase [Butyrivibrio sp. INlla16]